MHFVAVLSALTSIRSRLVAGVPSDELSSPFEPRAVLPYAALFALTVLGVVALKAEGFQFAAANFVNLLAIAIFSSAALGLRRLGHTRLAAAFDAISLTYGFGMVSMLVLVAAAALPVPTQDYRLHAVDVILGFDSKAYIQLTRPYLWVLKGAYYSFLWQAIAVTFILLAYSQESRLWRFLTANTIALSLVAVCFAAVPALGTFIYLGIQPSDIPELGKDVGPWRFGPQIQLLKSGYRELDWRVVGALVSFPSYHAAAAVLFSWAAWRTAFKWVVAALNFALVAAAPVFGAHYMIDLIGGVLVAIAALWITSFLPLLCAGMDAQTGFASQRGAQPPV